MAIRVDNGDYTKKGSLRDRSSRFESLT